MMTVSDVMCREVITVAPETSAREIARTLVRESISGVPVLDPDGSVVGVVSASDIMRVVAREPEVEVGFLTWQASGSDPATGENPGDAAQASSQEELAEWVQAVLVGDALDDLVASAIMTPASFYVRPDSSLDELADFLVRGRIHRALVIERGKLVGIVSSFDLLQTLASA